VLFCWVQGYLFGKSECIYKSTTGLHCGNTVKEKIECLLLGMDDFVVKTVQLGTDSCSRSAWTRLKEDHCLIT